MRHLLNRDLSSAFLGQEIALTRLARPAERIGLAQLVAATGACTSVAMCEDSYVRGDTTLGEIEWRLSDNLLAHTTRDFPTLEGLHLRRIPGALYDHCGLINALDAEIADAPGVVLRMASGDDLGDFLCSWAWRLRLEGRPSLGDLQMGATKRPMVSSALTRSGCFPPTLACSGITHLSQSCVLSPQGRELGQRPLAEMLLPDFREMVQDAVHRREQRRLILSLVGEDAARLGELVPEIAHFPAIEVPPMDQDMRLLSWLAESPKLDVSSLHSVHYRDVSRESESAVALALSDMLGAFWHHGADGEWRSSGWAAIQLGEVRAGRLFSSAVKRALRGAPPKEVTSSKELWRSETSEDLSELLRFCARLLLPSLIGL